MFGMGGSEIIVILIIALIFLGPEKLPSAAKSISKGIRDIKKQSRSLQQQIESDEQFGGAIRDIKSALRGEEEPPRPYKPRLPKVKTELPPATEEAVVPAVPTEASPAPLDAPAAVATITLPATAGEADADGPPARPDDDAELAGLIKPASGTVAKGS